MANDTQNKPGDKPTPASKAPDNKAPAPKEQAAKTPAPAAAPVKDAAQAKKPEAPAALSEKDEASKKEQEAPAVDNREEWEKPIAELDAEKKNQHKPRAPGQQTSKAKSPAPKAQTDKAPDSKKIVPFDKNKSAQEAKKAAEKAAAEKKVAEKKAAEKAAEEKAKKAAEEAKKVKLEKELREKFGIPVSDKPVEPWIAPEVEQVVRIPHDELHSFKDHPFNVNKDSKYLAFVASIRAHGVTQPAIVRPREGGGYEIVSGHRRDAGGKDAGYDFTPCIVRGLNDDQAIQQMVEDNATVREITQMELAKALDRQLDSLKHQGASDSLQKGEVISAEDVGKRSNQVVAERNGMSVKQVQRYISLTKLVPALQEMVDGKAISVNGKDKVIKIGFTPAVELSGIKQKDLQEYIAVTIEGQQSAPSLSQAQRMRKLADQKTLNPDVIDGILTEEKKEVDRVILSTEELSQYFGKDKTPREMKDTIMELLDNWKDQQHDISTPERKAEPEK